MSNNSEGFVFIAIDGRFMAMVIVVNLQKGLPQFTELLVGSNCSLYCTLLPASYVHKALSAVNKITAGHRHDKKKARQKRAK
jgi:hypothetical protein